MLGGSLLRSISFVLDGGPISLATSPFESFLRESPTQRHRQWRLSPRRVGPDEIDETGAPA